MNTTLLILSFVAAAIVLFVLLAGYIIFSTEDTYTDVHVKHVTKQQQSRQPTKIIPLGNENNYPLAS